MPCTTSRCAVDNERHAKKYHRRIILVGLAVCFSLSTNVALAAHQLIEDESGVLELQPTKKAGDATGQVKFEIVKETDGAQGTVRLAGKIQIKDLEKPEEVEVFVVDEEADRIVSLGRLNEDSELVGKVSVPEKNLKDLKSFDLIEILRRSKKGDKNQVLFTAELPLGKPQ